MGRAATGRRRRGSRGRPASLGHRGGRDADAPSGSPDRRGPVCTQGWHFRWARQVRKLVPCSRTGPWALALAVVLAGRASEHGGRRPPPDSLAP